MKKLILMNLCLTVTLSGLVLILAAQLEELRFLSQQLKTDRAVTMYQIGYIAKQQR